MGYIGAGPTRFNTADELTVTGDAEFNGDLTVKGTHITLDSATVQTVDLGDNDKIRLGDSDDLQIYHDGSHSYINEQGTGNLKIIGSDISIEGSGETYATFADDGAVTLYHDNAAKIATTATGVDVTGGLNTTGNVGIGTSSVTSGFKLEVAGGDVRFGDVYNDDAVEIGWSSGASQGFVQVYDRGAGAFRNLNLNNAVTIDSSGNVGVGTSSPDETVQVFQTAGSGNNYNEGTLKVGGSTTALGFQFGYHSISSGRNVITSLNNGGGANQRISIGFGAVDSNGEPATNVMTLNQSGNVGIGTASPTAGFRASINGDGSSIIGGVEFRNAASGGETFTIGHANATSTSGKLNVVGAGNLIFATNNTERMRITAAGGVAIGTASPLSGVMLDIRPTSTTRIMNTRSYDTSSQYHHAFENNSGTLVGNILVTTTSTAYSTSSDYRLKENVTDITDATTRLKQLNPVCFNFIADADTTVDGFLAHEVQSIVQRLSAEHITVCVTRNTKSAQPQAISTHQLLRLY